MKNKLALISIAVILFIGAFIAGKKVYQSKQGERLDVMAKADKAKFVPEHAPTIGPKDPEIYLVEFFDPECESCRDFYPFVKMILEENPGKIQLVMRYAPFHGNSRFAIKIIEAARKQGKYWEALEVLYRYQPQWGSHHEPKPELIWKYLPEAGVDIERIKVDMNDPAIEAMIEKDLQDGQVLGVRGTPTFFVNGKVLENFGLEPLRDLIQQNLAK